MPSPPPGFDPLVAGRYRNSGLLPSFKSPPHSLRAYPYTTSLERTLGLWHELHPDVDCYGRVDVSQTAAKHLRLEAVPGMDLCTPIPYSFEGQIHYFLPDVGARWRGDRPGFGEAGILQRKSTDQSRAAFAAAREFVAPFAGQFVLLLPGMIPRRWEVRALVLHLWRFSYWGREELLADIEAAWSVKRTPGSLIEEFAHRDRKLENVQHAVMRVAGDALAAGRLDLDLVRFDLELDTAVRLLPAS